MSTVDDADFVAGQSVVIQALAMQLNGGKSGQLRVRERRQRGGPEPCAHAHAQFKPVPVRLDDPDEQEAEEVSRARGLIGAATAGAVAAGATRLAYTVLNQRPPGGTKTWSRTNHRGEQVTLLEGPAVAVGAIAGALAQATLGPIRSGPLDLALLDLARPWPWPGRERRRSAATTTWRGPGTGAGSAAIWGPCVTAR